MAVSKAKKNIEKQKNSTTPKNNKSTNAKSPLLGEIICIATISIALLLMLGLFSKSGAGFLGGFVTSALIGILGLGAYILPFSMIIGSVVALFKKEKKLTVMQITMGLGLFVIAIAFVSTIDKEPIEEGLGALAYISKSYKNASVKNGGLIGNLLSDGLLTILGNAGTYVLLVSVGVVLSILITGKSLFGLIARIFAYFDNQVNTSIQHYKESRNEEWEYEDDDEEEYIDRSKKRAFDYTVEENLHALEELEEEKIHLVNDDIKNNKNKYPRIFDRSDKRIVKGDAPEEQVEQKDNVLHIAEDQEVFIETPMYNNDKQTAEAEKVVEHILAPWENEISVKGTGVEGYTPIAVTAEGEAVPKAIKKASPTEGVDLENLIALSLERTTGEYIYPPIELLKENPYVPSLSSKAQILENSRKLEETLRSFGVEAKVVEVSKGPTVTRYELSPGVGVKVSKISGLADDLALNLAAVGIRIEAPIPGKAVVGIEIPNKESQAVFLREVIEDESFWSYQSKICFAIGKDIAGNTVIADIDKMPHLLIAGATGSGKSVCINTLIASIIYKATPEEVKLLMIDPKIVELSVYNGIPHLLIPVVTDPKKAAGALNWAVREMDIRYNMFAETMTRDLKGYNGVRLERGEIALPKIVIIIDELADLMMTCGKEVEEAICRLAQKARASGIHLIIATQRPSVDVITGLIKANVPSRLAFAVSSGTDSRTILDMNGAEKLVGKGDMLFSPVGLSKPQRIQGSFISDKEVENLVNFIKSDKEHEYDEEMIEKITAVSIAPSSTDGGDEFMEEAIEFIVSKEKASVSMLQRRFRIGYNRAARMMEELESRGIVGPEDGSKPRKVLMSFYEWQEYSERQKI